MNVGVRHTPRITKTLIPLMGLHKKYYGEYPKWPILDDGNGCYDNFSTVRKTE